MATTTKILATANRYGNSNGNSYGSNGRVYVGKVDGGATYRSRLTFPGIRTLAAIGDANIVITKVTLHLRRDNGGPCTVTAGSSADSAWGAATDGSGSVTIAAQTAWYTIDITDCAQAILNYPGTWYIHLTGSGTRVRCSGIEDSMTPYINVVWEYSANTLTTDAESVELGKDAHFNIAPEEGDASYALTYEFGDEAGTIAETSDTSITWTPPEYFAAEIPEADSGEVKITMKVYDADGNQKRTEVLYLTVTVPETAVPRFLDDGISLVKALGGYALTGKTSVSLIPIIDTNSAYGAALKGVKAEIADGNYTQSFTWDTASETEPGIFMCSPQMSSAFINAGEAVVTVTLTDSRGREVASSRSVDVRAYANPLITAFSVERYEPVYDADEQISGYAPSDAGENVWVTLKASCSDIEGLNKIGWWITAKDADGETVYSGGGDALTVDLVNDRSVITAAVPAALAVEYTVEVIDTAGYNAYQYDNVVPGRANFALAASKYGASFGCMPKGTQEQPMLESAYPIYAYGGIDGVTNYTAEEVKTGGTWIDGKPIYRSILALSSISAANTWYYSDDRLSNVDTIIKYDAIIDNMPTTSQGRVVNAPLFRSSTDYTVAILQRQTEDAGLVGLTYWTNSSLMLAKTVRAIVYYTKTTD